MKTFLEYLPCFFTTIVFIISIVYIALQYKTAFSIPFNETKIILKINFVSLILSYLLIGCDYAFDIFIGTFPDYPYIIFGYGPSPFIFSALISFIDYLMTYCFFNFKVMTESRFYVYKKTIYILYSALWIFSISIISGIFYNSAFGGKTWYTVYFYYISILNPVVGVYIIYLIIIIRDSLKRFPATLRDKKLLLILVVIFASTGVIARIVNAIIYLTGVLEYIQNPKDYYYDSIYYSILTIFTQLLPTLSYVQYLKKDSRHFAMINQGEYDESSKSSIIGSASIVESTLTKLLIAMASRDTYFLKPLNNY